MKYLKSLFLQLSINSHSYRYQIPSRRKHFVLPSIGKYNTFDNNSIHKVISEVKSEREYLDIIPNIENIIKSSFKYNSRGEKYHIINTVLYAYNMIESPENITEDSFHQAFVLAWAAQMTDACNNITNKKNCQEMTAQNFSKVADCSAENLDLLRSFMYVMIEHHFQDTKWYPHFLHLYNKAFFYNAISQYLDHNSRKHNNTFATINANQYEKLCDYKVSYPYFELPLLLAMTLANKTDLELVLSMGRICSQMGMLYQIQEHFENCFGTETMIGTEGTDIQEGKCTWLAVTALERFTPRQRVVFEACYGSEEPAHVERVKLLYKQLRLPQLFREREGALCDSIMQQAETLEKSGIPYKLFEDLLRAIRDEKPF